MSKSTEWLPRRKNIQIPSFLFNLRWRFAWNTMWISESNSNPGTHSLVILRNQLNNLRWWIHKNTDNQLSTGWVSCTGWKSRRDTGGWRLVEQTQQCHERHLVSAVERVDQQWPRHQQVTCTGTHVKWIVRF